MTDFKNELKKCLEYLDEIDNILDEFDEICGLGAYKCDPQNDLEKLQNSILEVYASVR